MEAPLRLAELRLAVAKAFRDDGSILGRVGLCNDLHEVLACHLQGGVWLGAKMYRRELADAELGEMMAPL